MGINLKAIAKQATENNNASKVIEGLEKIKLEEMVATYGKKLSIIAVDIVRVNDTDTKSLKDAAVMVVAEAKDKWTFGGGSLLSIVSAWLAPDEETGEAPTIEEVNTMLKKAPLVVELEKRAQKNDPRKSFWHYSILD